MLFDMIMKPTQIEVKFDTLSLESGLNKKPLKIHGAWFKIVTSGTNLSPMGFCWCFGECSIYFNIFGVWKGKTSKMGGNNGSNLPPLVTKRAS
jgi:hypothetical protein